MTQTPDRPSADLRLSIQAEAMQNSPVADKAQLFDYRQAANPIRRGLTEPIPYRSWGAELHSSGPSGIIPLDLSAELGTTGPATSPGLAAHFIRIEAGEGVRAAASATSSLFFVLSGTGVCHSREAEQDTSIHWSEGDLFVLPSGGTPLLEASSTSVLYWVHDAPLLSYLGVVPSQPRFDATHYRAEWLPLSCSNSPSNREALAATASACCWPTAIYPARAPSPTCSGRCTASFPPVQPRRPTAINRSPWT